MVKKTDAAKESRKPGGGSVDFAGPAEYRILVQGRLGEDWSDRLNGMAITAVLSRGSVSQTQLLGAMSDQAALQGVLDALYNLHLPILEVKRVGSI